MNIMVYDKRVYSVSGVSRQAIMRKYLNSYYLFKSVLAS
jgi:hypothetical protein